MSAISLNLRETTQPIINSINHILPRIPAAILVLLVGILVLRLLLWLVRFCLGLTRLPKALIDIISSLTHVALWIFLAIAFLQFFGLNSVALAVTGSFAFVVLGISQGGASTVADVIAGLALARDKDFSVGDRISLGYDKTQGVIEKMDIGRTRVREDDGKLHVISNSTIDKNGWVLLEKRQDLQSESKFATIKQRK